MKYEEQAKIILEELSNVMNITYILDDYYLKAIVKALKIIENNKNEVCE